MELPRPHSLSAERAVLGRMMASGERAAGEVIGNLVADDFFDAAHQALFERLVENYYADDSLDPLTIGRSIAGKLRGCWGTSEEQAVTRVREMSASIPKGNIRDHAKIVRDDSNRRRILDLSTEIQKQAVEGNPEEVASILSESAMRIATSSLLKHEIINFGDLGRRAIREMNLERQMKAQGVELGARFKMAFLDRFLRGLRPTELLMAAGEPGVGKSAVFWKAALNFAESQQGRDPEVATLVLSLEMGEKPTHLRLAQTLTGISGTTLRDADMTEADMRRIVQQWGRRKNLPLHFNFTSSLRESQLRALVVEAIRKHNVGLVVIDHFKHLHTDERFRNATEADEHKAQFLKDAIAEDLNVAVICLAHTTKGVAENPDKRPQLTNLRGSYQIAAIADFVAFLYRPYPYASEESKLTGEVSESDAEIIFRKNRHGLDGAMPFMFDGEKMEIR